jgi:hypothetical protein
VPDVLLNELIWFCNDATSAASLLDNVVKLVDNVFKIVSINNWALFLPLTNISDYLKRYKFNFLKFYE